MLRSFRLPSSLVLFLYTSYLRLYPSAKKRLNPSPIRTWATALFPLSV
ncbi:hypothetical protein AvCA_23110 [Azotobacter vinelandii CA]|uniref:Uncharacterized protein n=2 Tax=Azotobacter vinelandii TaxID=354 RepID=C1DGI8_AZOVD|nr:hypothetical protein Avin_23110 [Azotobacter vinelandii DJ]AGK16709.1 hypothetical protein AvCA_23110 [Azotobacter vinelandii CA]AGK20560.1 hypothetical protein AvCA6_23110 [Azotobacter vinelandii CA6]